MAEKSNPQPLNYTGPGRPRFERKRIRLELSFVVPRGVSREEAAIAAMEAVQAIPEIADPSDAISNLRPNTVEIRYRKGPRWIRLVEEKR